MQIQPPPPLPIHVYLMNPPEAPWYLRPDWWVAGGTILLAIVTCILAWYTYRLFAAAKEAREDSLKSLVAAEKTADASYQSAEASRLNAQAAADAVTTQKLLMQRDLRAYIVLKDIVISTADEYGIPVRAVAQLTNAGRTPSQHQYCFCSLRVLERVPYESEFEGKDELRDIHDLLGPGQVREVTRESIRTQEEQADLMAERKFLVLHGHVRYENVFSSEPNITSFCQVWDYKFKEFVPKGRVNFVT